MGQNRRLLAAGAVLAEPLNDLDDLRRRWTIGGVPTVSVSPFGKALTLDGAADYVDLDTMETLLRFDAGTQDFAVAVWIKTSTAGLQILLDKRDGDNDGWVLFLDASSRPAFSVDAIDVVGVTGIDDGAWHHVACVIDRSGNGQMYLDGATDGAAVAIGGEVMATTTVPRIGAVSYGVASYFTGSLRDMVVIDRMFSAQEIQDIAVVDTFGRISRSLVSHWDMSSINPPDIGWRGLGNDGTGTGLVAATDIVNGIAGGKATEFDGATEFVNCGNDPSLHPLTSDFSVAWWMNMPTQPGDFRYMIDHGNGAAAAGHGFTIRARLNGNLTVYFNDGNVGAALVRTIVYDFRDMWYHVVLSFDRDTYWRVYVDGEYIVQQDISSRQGSVVPPYDFILGGRSVPAHAVAPYLGKLDGVMRFNAALTQLQVRDLKNRQWQGRM